MTRGYTAAQLAKALGCSPRAVQKRLAGIAPTGTVVVRGIQAATWALTVLPDGMMRSVQQAAACSGHRSAAAMLDAPPVRWNHRVPLARIHPDAMSKAAKLRDALAESMAAYTMASGARSLEMATDAIARHRQIVGHVVSAGHMRRIMDRAVDRDRGFSEWQRTEIYVDERPATLPPAGAGGKSHVLIDLQTAVQSVADPARPTPGEMELIWVNACEEIERLTDKGTPLRKALNVVIAVLAHAPGLCGKSRSALLKTLRRRLARWEESGGEFAAVRDGRENNCDRRGRLELSDEDRHTIIARAVIHGGRLAPAWNELVRQNALSPELLQRLGGPRCSKSSVPTTIRESLMHEIRMLQPHRRGPRAAALAGAFINRDPDTIAAGDWFQADDCTLPVYYLTEDVDGATRVVRGQFLLMIDVRSMMALGFVLIPEKSYSAFHVRNLMTRVSDEHGLPRQGYYFENGLWRKSRLIKGRQEEMPWEDTEKGMRSLGLRFVHAKYPRGKVVERVLGAFQDLMEGDPGYVGRDEKRDRFERVYKSLLDVRAGRLEAPNVLWTEGQWTVRLTELCNRYNETPQEGKYLRGRSPREVFEATYSSPLVRLDWPMRYLLATHRMREKVTGNGITIRFGKQTFRYKGESAGRFIGREVLCYFNPESPEMLSFESPNGSEIHTVEREIIVPAMDAPRDVLAAAHAQNAAQNRHARELYQAIKPRLSDAFEQARFRITLPDQASAARGAVIARHEQAIRAERAADEASDRDLNRAAQRIGLSSFAASADPERRRMQLEGLRELRDLGITADQED